MTIRNTLKPSLCIKPEQPDSAYKGKALASLLALVGAGMIALGLTSWLWACPLTVQAADSRFVSVNVNDVPLAREAKLSGSFAPTVERVAPSVVYVYSTKTVKHPFGSELRPFFDAPFFRRFFGEPFEQPKPRSQKRQRLDSGVIVTKDGYIPTNSHVVDGVDEIKVGLLDRKRDYTAKAERKRRAKIVNAEGEFQAAQKMVQAAALISTQPIAPQLRFLQTMREISGEKNRTTFLPLPIDLFTPFLKRGTDDIAKGARCLQPQIML